MKTLLPSLVLSVMLAIPWRPLPAEENANIGGFLLKNARVLDVNRGRLGEPTRVRILGNRIDAIGNRLEIGAEQSVVIDLDGRVLIPGLIDLHTHLLLHPYNEATWDDQVLREQLELRAIRGTVHARKSLESGFTSIRDLGTEGAGFADVAIRSAILQGLIPGPRVFAVTKALVTSGGYGPAGFDPRFSLPKGAQTADGADGVRRATREQIAAGADWIKVYADYPRKSGDRATPTFTDAELNAIVDEARSAGLKVAAHATTDAGIRRAVAAGVATIEHGYEASLATLQLMRDNQVVLCPTLAAAEAMAVYSGWKPGEADHPRIVTAKTLMKHAVQSGVIIACGSDVGVFAHGQSVREMELMFAFGMTSAGVLQSATHRAAQVLGKGDELGLVSPKYLADLVVVEGNPIEDISVLRKPLLVFKDGKLVVDRR